MKKRLESLGFGPNDIKLLTSLIPNDMAEAERLAYLFHLEEPLHVPAFLEIPSTRTDGIKGDPVRGARLLAVWLATCQYVGSVIPETNQDETDTSSMQAHAGLVLLAQRCLGENQLHSGLARFSNVPWFWQALKDATFEYCSTTTLKPIIPGATIDSLVYEGGRLRMRAEVLLQAMPNSDSMDQYRFNLPIEVPHRGKSFLDKQAREQLFQNCYELANESIFSHQLPSMFERLQVSGAQREWKHFAPYPEKIEETREKKKPVFPSLKLWRK